MQNYATIDPFKLFKDSLLIELKNPTMRDKVNSLFKLPHPEDRKLILILQDHSVDHVTFQDISPHDIFKNKKKILLSTKQGIFFPEYTLETPEEIQLFKSALEEDDSINFDRQKRGLPEYSPNAQIFFTTHSLPKLKTLETFHWKVDFKELYSTIQEKIITESQKIQNIENDLQKIASCFEKNVWLKIINENTPHYFCKDFPEIELYFQKTYPELIFSYKISSSGLIKEPLRETINLYAKKETITAHEKIRFKKFFKKINL